MYKPIKYNSNFNVWEHSAQVFIECLKTGLPVKASKVLYDTLYFMSQLADLTFYRESADGEFSFYIIKQKE